VLGLALGIAASVIIIQYVSFELNYDNFHENEDRIHRLTIKFIFEGNPLINSAGLANGFGPEFKRLIPEIEDQIRIHRHTDNYTVTADASNDLTGKFSESRVYYTDSSFFCFFSFPLIKGNKSTVLAEANSAVLSEHIAEKYYGKDWRKMPDLLDKYIIVDSKDDHGAMPFRITGIFAETPNSHFQPDILLSYSTLVQKIDPLYNNGFGLDWMAFYTYIKISPNSSTTAVIEKIHEYFKREWARAFEQG
jgi:putative ABC transport system permease protein